MLEAREQASLATGHWRGQHHHRQVVLRAITGEDELAVLGATSSSVARRASTLLARCLVDVEGVEVVTPAAVGALTVGDRESLLLRLRRLTFGERISGVARCPGPECGEALDFDLSISELLAVAPGGQARQTHEIEVEAGGRVLRVEFRLPTGSDQEVAAEALRARSGDPETLLLQRCVVGVRTLDDQPVEDWSPAELSAVEERMAELDPLSELELSVRCPACRSEFSTVLDAATLLLEELGSSQDALFREVHTLAFHYHWCERDILGMTRARRHRYLELLADELS